jgi:hypothetical protein
MGCGLGFGDGKEEILKKQMNHAVSGSPEVISIMTA